MKWTTKMVDVLRKRYAMDGPKALAARFGLTAEAVIGKARRMGLGTTRKNPPKGFKWTEERLQEVRRRYVKEGGDKLAEEYGVVLSTVQRAAVSMGLRTNAGKVRAGEILASRNKSFDLTFFDSWSNDMAYILGFAFADGNINSDRTALTFTLSSKDECVLLFIRRNMKGKTKIYRRGAYTDRRGSQCKGTSTFIVSSTVIVKRLMGLGVLPRKTYNDDPFPSVPDEFLAPFVRGYLDGDGSVSVGSNGVCSISFVGSPRFIEGLTSRLVDRLGVRNNKVQIRGTKTKWASVCWYGLADMKLFRDFLYSDLRSFCLRRKRDKLLKWLSVERFSRGHYFGNGRDKKMNLDTTLLS